MPVSVNKFSKNLLLFTISVLVSLCIAELLVRIILPQDKLVTWLEMHPQGFMMNQKGGEASQEHNGNLINYSFTDSRLRSSKSASDFGAKKVLALGDSFTFGLLLQEEGSYIHLLNEKLKTSGADSVQILNGGVGGAGLADWPAWLEYNGVSIQPDIILYFLNIHDLERALSKNIYVVQRDSLIKSQRWKPRGFMQSLGKQSWYRWLQGNSELFTLIVKVLWRNIYFVDLTESFDQNNTAVLIPKNEQLYIESEYSLNLGVKLFEKMNSWCEENGCELIITTTGFFPHAEESFHTMRLYNFLADDSSLFKDEIKFFDPSFCVDSTIGSNYNSIIIPEDTHPNRRGSEIISDCIWKLLQKDFTK